MDIETYHEVVAGVVRGDVRMISGCQDAQLSGDEGAEVGGMCTSSMIACWASGEVDTWATMLSMMYRVIRARDGDQTPLLSASRMFDLQAPFSFVNPSRNGRTRALIIGVNYVGTDGELGGCHTDAQNMMGFIAELGYSMNEEDCMVLMDDGEHESPGLENIMNGISWLVSEATEGDSLFFFFAGHGSRQNDDTGEEGDGMDETICPVDCDTAGHLTDDDILKHLVLPIPEGVTLTAVVDACHSGSVFDLPFTCDITEETLASLEAGEMFLKPNDSFHPEVAHQFREELEQVVEEEEAPAEGEEEVEERNMTDIEIYHGVVVEVVRGDVRMISGCQDAQLSGDEGAEIGGMCTSSMIACWASGEVDTWATMLSMMYRVIRARDGDQTPLLSASRMFDLQAPFSFVNPSSNGRTRALIIGVNYVGTDGELGGCHTDAQNMMGFIAELGYSMNEEDCMVLMDDGEHESPGLENIMNGISWLVSEATEGDSLFFFFAGHGSRQNDDTGEEGDGMDETICPVDCDTAGHLTDDDILKHLVLPIPEGVTLTAVVDACHSGSVFDLPFTCDITEETLASLEAGEMFLKPNDSFHPEVARQFREELEQVVEEEA